jgi:hypothetical protein
VPYYFTDTQKVSVPASFFIGWRQLDAQRLNLGLDRNIDHSDKVKYSVDGGFTWLTSPFEGSAMIHPIFSTALDTSLGLLPKNMVPSQWAVYPNPATQQFTVKLPAALQGTPIYLIDALGQVQAIQTAPTFDISTLPNGVYFLQCPKTNLGVLKLVINH